MLDEGVLPLPYKIAEKAKELRVKRIYLDWQGGSDEGYLDVNTDPSPYGVKSPKRKAELQDLCNAIQEWASEAWEYSGSGDGSDYGDSLVYDLKKGTVEASEWYMERKDCDLENEKLCIAEP
jgi:hypothetical protein